MENRKNNQKIRDKLSFCLLALVAAGVLVLVFKWSLAQTLPAQKGNISAPNSNDPCSLLSDKTTKLVESLKKKNIFVPPPPKPKPPKQCQGIFGDQVLINGKWYKVGDTVPPGAKVLAVEAASVKLEWKGKEIILAPIKAATTSGPKPPAKKAPRRTKKTNPGKKPEKIEPAEQEEPVDEDDLAWLDIPEHLKEKFRKTWDKMTPEQKEKGKEQWQKMSEEEKQQAIEQMEKMP
ncbi:MAG: hypothetical protein KAJ52_00240 [Sedimentisphaerales bacterium]|nr:hypothetical protein [Sedimentisphaerales bacterium]